MTGSFQKMIGVHIRGTSWRVVGWNLVWLLYRLKNFFRAFNLYTSRRWWQTGVVCLCKSKKIYERFWIDIIWRTAGQSYKTTSNNNGGIIQRTIIQTLQWFWQSALQLPHLKKLGIPYYWVVWIRGSNVICHRWHYKYIRFLARIIRE